MEPFQSRVVAAAVLSLSMFWLGGALAGEAEDQVKYEWAAKFLGKLLENSQTIIKRAPGDCASFSRGQKVKVGRELAAILRPPVSEGRRLYSVAECDQAVHGALRSCTLIFTYDDPELQWSAGFTFMGNTVSGEIDMNTLACFHTP
jgi:hypothetical protein